MEMDGSYVLTLVLVVFALSLPSYTGQVQSTSPNIILIVADDLGWDDVSFHGSNQIPTPNLDTLAYDGIILNNYYVQLLCTPSRSALMTGRYPIHLGMQHYVIGEITPYGLGLNETLLPQYLKQLGYATHWVGKWHLGYFAKEYTPKFRGFDTQFGYFNGEGDYWTHKAQTNYDGQQYYGLDLHDDEGVVWNETGNYSTELFTRKAEDIIQQHDTDKPLFLYLAHQAVHAGNAYDPLQAPSRYDQKFAYIKDKRRRTFAGMVSELDESVGNITKALQARNLLHNSIIVFTTDNGGPTDGMDGNCACNWPLRGMKYTLWEGGVRGVSFVWSPLLKSSRYVSPLLMHVSDWMPTILHAAGYDMNKLPQNLDSFDMWNALNAQAQDNLRTEILLNIDHQMGMAALRVENMKLVIGLFNGIAGWYPPLQLSLGSKVKDMDPVQENLVNFEKTNTKYFSLTEIQKIYNQVQLHETAPDPLFHTDLEDVLRKIGRQPLKVSSPVVVNCGPKPANASTNCNPAKAPCLFDVKVDPCEYNNLADSQPAMLKEMLERLALYNATVVPPRNKPEDPQGLPIHHNGTFVPWVDQSLV